ISCVLFARTVYRNKIRQIPDHGREVVLEGYLTIFSQRGSYQFFVENVQIESSKEGELYQEYLRLKKELDELGYFDPENKKSLPTFPRRVGIITSPTGAAVHDIIQAFKRRNPTIQLTLFPTSVQGENASKEITAAIELANQLMNVDVLLISRGGGSLEDLSVFNDRSVADAVFLSRIPIVSGIGHDTDVTIVDWVADKPMPTPTAAAEMISTPSINEMLLKLSTFETDLQNRVLSRLGEFTQQIDLAEARLVHPKERITNLKSQFSAYGKRLVSEISRTVDTQSGTVKVNYQRLLNQSPTPRIDQYSKNLVSAADRLMQSTTNLQDKFAARVESLATQLETMNPQATLNRGYAIVRSKKDNTILTDANSVSPGDKVKAQLAKGALDLDVESISS
ncbi:MAG: exodeoxyribonuclease VII large subunit, partial [Gammaproteobacteria bacterium]|nr:exodeoxyribonuclease VII large subunit [Gammaproteobacteria bacterium]